VNDAGTSPGAAAPSPATAAFSLTVPASWFELDLHPASSASSISAMVDERLRDQPELSAHRPAVVRLLRRQARTAWESGAVYCACSVDPTDDGPLTAAVTVSVIDPPLDAPVDAGGRERLDPLLHRLKAKEPAGPDDTWTRVEVVHLDGALPAARTAGVEDVDVPDGGGWIRSVLMQTFVPVPGMRKVVLVTCSSPVVPLADVLLDLFDAVTSTLRLVPAD